MHFTRQLFSATFFDMKFIHVYICVCVFFNILTRVAEEYV